MNVCFPMFCTTRFVARPLTVLGGSVERVAFVLALVCALMAPSAARGQCPPAWVAGVGTPGTNGDVNAMVVLPGGDVIVGGTFTSAGGVSASRIARYNASTGVWSALGSGVNGGVGALAVLPGGDVLVGGAFNNAGGVGVNKIARYNPTTGVWSSLGAAIGSGVDGEVNALVVLPGGDVLVGGSFTFAGGVSANNIARCNPSTGVWSALGSGLVQPGFQTVIRALAVLPGGDVLVGGSFTLAGGVSANRIARYNPSTGVWSALGSGVDGGLNALVVLPGGDVIVGGGFTTAGGVSANSIARYNPSTGVWSALGSGTNLFTNALAVVPGGDVIVGGIFSAAGGVSATRIARYNPSTGVWSALGSGTNDRVKALAVLPSGDVIVGGLFTAAGGVPANNIARYFLGGPSPSILWQPVAFAATPSGSAVFSVVPSANSGGALTYQWYKNGAFLSTSTNSTANAPTLYISSVQAGDLGSYSCIVTSPCGSALSNPAVLSFVRPTCGPSDVAGPGQSPGSDGQLTADDIIVFLNRFFAGC